CLVLHGSAAGDEWVAGRSDLNTALVVPCVTLAVLERLAPLVARWRERGFALPVVMDYEYLRRARDTFPMALDDISRQHRLLVGPLPTMRKLLALRAGDARLSPAALRAAFGAYLAEVERIVEGVDALDA